MLRREEKLYCVVDALKAEGSIEAEAADWWNFTRRHSLNSLPQLLKEERNKKNVRVALVLEQVTVTIARALLADGDQPPSVLHGIKNIVYYLHQNYLVLMDILYGKIPATQLDNTYAELLETTVQAKRARRTKHGENFFFLKQNNDMISSFLRTLLKSKAVVGSRRPGPGGRYNRAVIINTCSFILKNLDKNAFQDVRDTLEKALEVKGESEGIMPPL